MNIPERRTWDDHPKRVHKLQNSAFVRAPDFKAENCSKQTGRKGIADYLRIRMVRISTVMNTLNLAMLREPTGQSFGIVALTLEPQRQRFHAPHRQVTLE